MKQPENKSSAMFGNDDSIDNDAEIIIHYEGGHCGGPEPVLRLPFWYCGEEIGLFEHFEKAVLRAAESLGEAYTYWPEGYVHIQVVVNRKYLNII